MKKNERNEELQSRREFFKKAAKGALPILGAMVLANAPVIANAAETSSTTCAGCNNRCMNFCTTTCHGGCKTHCADNCHSSCKWGCSRVSK